MSEKKMDIAKLLFYVTHSIAVAGVHLDDDNADGYVLHYADYAQKFIDEIREKLSDNIVGPDNNSQNTDDTGERSKKNCELLRRDALCSECMSESCIFNPEGICRYPMLCGTVPNYESEDGCNCFVPKEMQ